MEQALRLARQNGMKSWGKIGTLRNWLARWSGEGRRPAIIRKHGSVDRPSFLAALEKYVESLSQ